MLPICYKCECGYKVYGDNFQAIYPYLEHKNQYGVQCFLGRKK